MVRSTPNGIVHRLLADLNDERGQPSDQRLRQMDILAFDNSISMFAKWYSPNNLNRENFHHSRYIMCSSTPLFYILPEHLPYITRC